jgi:hypothetical protein
MAAEGPGFVYLWHDTFRDTWYVGSHKGTTDDGYVCGPRWMRHVRRLRLQHFRRRVIEWHDSISTKELRARERRWLVMIREDELGTKYYNVSRLATGWTKGEKRSLESRKRVGDAQRGKKRGPYSEERRKNISAAKLGHKHSEERRANQSMEVLARPKLTCPHCGDTFTTLNYGRWHGDRCRHRT